MLTEPITYYQKRLFPSGIVHFSNIFKKNRGMNVLKTCCLMSLGPLQHYFWSPNTPQSGAMEAWSCQTRHPPCKPAELQERIEDRKLSWRLCTNCNTSSIPADHMFPLLETSTKLALEETRAVSCCFLINLYQLCKFQIWVMRMTQSMASGLSGHDWGNFSLPFNSILMILASFIHEIIDTSDCF